jgi:3-isopropylmalate/(R)-2-methylmalate dehydratase small subunit
VKPFRQHRGIAAPLLVDNIDTDQIIPSREMKRVSKLGLGDGLFAGWRYSDDAGKRGEEIQGFVLNQPRYRDATILLAGKNFGCGSSREHAVWALADFGIRAVIAESFGRIFRSNCARNGLLAIDLAGECISRLASAAGEVSIDLEAELLDIGADEPIEFKVDPGDREMLLKGLDYIDFALQYSADIDRFITGDRQRRPWAYLERKT